MKIKEGFILTEVGHHFMLVPEGGPQSNIMFLNNTAKFIVECLQEETTENNIFDKMAEKYDASREDIVSSIKITLEKLREIDALIE